MAADGEAPPADDGRDEKTRLAEDRTDWAEDRTILANERTFAGWMRTGMASVAVAIGLRAVFRDADPTWVPKLVATIFIVSALAIFWTARNNARTAQDRLTSHAAEIQPSRLFTVLASLFSVGAVATGLILWSL